MSKLDKIKAAGSAIKKAFKVPAVTGDATAKSFGLTRFLLVAFLVALGIFAATADAQTGGHQDRRRPAMGMETFTKGVFNETFKERWACTNGAMSNRSESFESKFLVDFQKGRFEVTTPGYSDAFNFHAPQVAPKMSIEGQRSAFIYGPNQTWQVFFSKDGLSLDYILDHAPSDGYFVFEGKAAIAQNASMRSLAPTNVFRVQFELKINYRDGKPESSHAEKSIFELNFSEKKFNAITHDYELSISLGGETVTEIADDWGHKGYMIANGAERFKVWIEVGSIKKVVDCSGEPDTYTVYTKAKG